MKEKTQIRLWAMSLIGALEAINLVTLGADGVILSGVVGIICGLAGYTIAKVK